MMAPEDFSKGERFKFKPLSSSFSEQTVPITLHKHEAEKAGTHFDLRLGGKGDWAIRYFPKSTGEKRLAVRQPTHPIDYYGFEGDISEGYGKGRVSKVFEGKGVIESWSSDKINFSFDSKHYTLIRTQPPDKWMIIMRNPDLKKISFLMRNNGDRIKDELKFDSFSDTLAKIGLKKKKSLSTKGKSVTGYEESPIMLRAIQPLDHSDIELNQGPRTRASIDMALGNTGF